MAIVSTPPQKKMANEKFLQKKNSWIFLLPECFWINGNCFYKKNSKTLLQLASLRSLKKKNLNLNLKI